MTLRHHCNHTQTAAKHRLFCRKEHLQPQLQRLRLKLQKVPCQKLCIFKSATLQCRCKETALLLYCHGSTRCAPSTCSMQEVVAAQSASLICFNLGYLPSASDKDATATIHQTTVPAVAAALQTINQHGLISILAYTGHPGKSALCSPSVLQLPMLHWIRLAALGGQEEYEAVKQQLCNLPAAAWTITEHRYLNRPNAPRLICVAPHRL